MSASVMQNLSRAPESAPDAPRYSALNGPRTADGPATIKVGLQLIPSPNDAAGALQSSSLQIARLQSNPEAPTARAASEAYMTQAAGQTQVSLRGQTSGSTSINIFA